MSPKSRRLFSIDAISVCFRPWPIHPRGRGEKGKRAHNTFLSMTQTEREKERPHLGPDLSSVPSSLVPLYLIYLISALGRTLELKYTGC